MSGEGLLTFSGWRPKILPAIHPTVHRTDPQRRLIWPKLLRVRKCAPRLPLCPYSSFLKGSPSTLNLQEVSTGTYPHQKRCCSSFHARRGMFKPLSLSQPTYQCFLSLYKTSRQVFMGQSCTASCDLIIKPRPYPTAKIGSQHTNQMLASNSSGIHNQFIHSLPAQDCWSQGVYQTSESQIIPSYFTKKVGLQSRDATSNAYRCQVSSISDGKQAR